MGVGVSLRPRGQRVERSGAVDGFRLAYDRFGTGVPVVLLHGWPSDRTEYRDVVPLLNTLDVVVPDLRGFGESDKHPGDPSTNYSAEAQARSVIGLIEELRLDRPVLGGHDIGSRIAVAVARLRPDLIRELVLTPPLPGIGARILSPEAQQQFWYVSFNQLALADELIDGKPDAVRAFLRHFWSQWSGPDFALTDHHLDHLVSMYSPPGAFSASVAWYRVGAGSGPSRRRTRAHHGRASGRTRHRALAVRRCVVPWQLGRSADRIFRRPADSPPRECGAFHPVGEPTYVRRQHYSCRTARRRVRDLDRPSYRLARAASIGMIATTVSPCTTW